MQTSTAYKVLAFFAMKVFKHTDCYVMFAELCIMDDSSSAGCRAGALPILSLGDSNITLAVPNLTLSLEVSATPLHNQTTHATSVNPVPIIPTQRTVVNDHHIGTDGESIANHMSSAQQAMAYISGVSHVQQSPINHILFQENIASRSNISGLQNVAYNTSVQVPQTVTSLSNVSSQSHISGVQNVAYNTSVQTVQTVASQSNVSSQNVISGLQNVAFSSSVQMLETSSMSQTVTSQANVCYRSDEQDQTSDCGVQNSATHNTVTQNSLAQNNATPNSVSQNNVTQNNVTQNSSHVNSQQMEITARNKDSIKTSWSQQNSATIVPHTETDEQAPYSSFDLSPQENKQYMKMEEKCMEEVLKGESDHVKKKKSGQKSSKRKKKSHNKVRRRRMAFLRPGDVKQH